MMISAPSRALPSRSGWSKERSSREKPPSALAATQLCPAVLPSFLALEFENTLPNATCE